MRKLAVIGAGTMGAGIAQVAAEAGLNRLLLDTRYATPEQLGLDAPDMIERAGDYALYRLQVGSHDGMAVRAEADGACAAGGAT